MTIDFETRARVLISQIEFERHIDSVRIVTAALRQLVQDCIDVAETQAQDIGKELPEGHGGDWAKRFGRNVALSIAGAIRYKFGIDR